MDSKISELPIVPEIQDNATIPIEQDGMNYKVHVQSIKGSSPINIITGEIVQTNHYLDDVRIYSKRVNIGTLPNAEVKTVPTGLDPDNIIIIEPLQGIAKSTTDTTIPLPFVSTTPLNAIGLSIDADNNILVTTGIERSNFSGYVNIYFTYVGK